MLCVYRLHPRAVEWTTPANHHPPQRIGPLWKLRHVVEPRPLAIETLALRDEKNERFVLDGPFTETKA